MGAAGAALGYCQALFSFEGTPRANTARLVRLLTEIEAPWAASHELYWGHRRAVAEAVFLEEAVAPLCGSGRVPIVISSLDPARDYAEIERIVSCSPPIQSGESLLLRLSLSGEQSVDAVVRLIRGLMEQVERKREMPLWWPLLQGAMQPKHWERLRKLLGGAWEFVNVAVNPFTTSGDSWPIILDQVTVAQVVVGEAAKTCTDGTIVLPAGMAITGRSSEGRYHLFDYFAALGGLREVPTLILLGPAEPQWTDSENQRRIGAVLELLEPACAELWSELSEPRRALLWRLSA